MTVGAVWLRKKWALALVVAVDMTMLALALVGRVVPILTARAILLLLGRTDFLDLLGNVLVARAKDVGLAIVVAALVTLIFSNQPGYVPS